MKKVALYVRVSTPDQHVESQLYDLRELASQRGFEVVHEYEDRGISGTKARRPGLDALMADARRKKFSAVAVAADVIGTKYSGSESSPSRYSRKFRIRLTP